jgi:hypothetical protein
MFLSALLTLGPRATPADESAKAKASASETTLRFEVTLAKGLLEAPTDGRLLVVLGRGGEPRQRISTGMNAFPLLGADVKSLAPDVTGVIDQTSAIFPIAHLSKLPAREYTVQAVFAYNRDLQLVNAPGNLYSEPISVKIDPAKGGTIKLKLVHKVGPEKHPAETDYVKYVKLKSELLSKFHKRDVYLRAGIILPRDFDKDKDRKYPLRVHVGGFGSRYTAVQNRFSGLRKLWLDDNTPRMIFLQLDGSGPFGDPYQVNSANNGPYGDAITQELIPYVEKTYRGIGQPYARVLDGSSTGGWVSLALQIFYPDFFNGAWSNCPDPVDFRAYELINIYQDENAYVNRFGFERPAMRTRDGEVRYTVRHECQLEVVLGRGSRWELAGRDWCSWNATYGPRGEDGLPRPLWDGKTGKIDPGVLEHWKKYDLRLVLQNDWKTLGPKLRGKLRIWVGEADDYYLNNAVHLLDDFLKTAKPAFEGSIRFGARAGHTSGGWTEKQLMEEMAAVVAKGQKEAKP